MSAESSRTVPRISSASATPGSPSTKKTDRQPQCSLMIPDVAPIIDPKDAPIE
jgi:hypothetical protein